MKNKFINIISFILAIALFTIGCEKGPDFRKFNYPAQVPSGISPTSGFPTTNVTITGKNFDTLTGAVKVWFGGIQATTIVSCTNNQIIVQVPTNAVSGKVSLQVWTTKVDSVGTYTVIPLPTLTSVISKGVTPIFATPGVDTVLIRGSHFLTDALKVSVAFNGTPVTNIVSLKDTLITVIAPTGYTTGFVTVNFNGFILTSSSALSPALTKGDISSLFLKNYMQPFTAKNMVSAQGFTGSNWGTPDYWTVNSAAQNQLNSGATQRCGGLNFGESGYANIGQLCLQAGWGDAIGNVMTNGKMYQTVTLPAGTYRIDVQVVESGFASYLTSSNMYLVAAQGNTLPDFLTPSIAPTPALASVGIQNGVSYNATSGPVQSITFTLSQNTQVSIGFVTTMVANSYGRLNYMKLNLL